MRTISLLWLVIVLLLLTDGESRSQPAPILPKVVPLRSHLDPLSIQDYNAWREAYMQLEESKSLGHDILLTPDELQANQIIMETKIAEYEEGLATPHMFAPSQHLFEVLDKIKESKVFQMISKMPKGGVLHAHDTALCSTDFVIELTYRDNLWVCYSSEIYVRQFKFSTEAPPNEEDDCTWELISSLRDSMGADKVDEHLRERMTLYPKTKFEDNNEVWRDFTGIFGLVNGLLFYAPVWEDYYYNALKEFLADGVQYIEVRTTLPILYDLTDKEYTVMDTARIFAETLNRFKEDNPDFIGSKLIYAPLRIADDDKFEEYRKNLIDTRTEYPTFIAGFDLVGQEEMGRPLIDFVPKLLEWPADIEYFFHAGETNWFGSSIDENLIDAILLGAKRIGHGYAITKHPFVLEMIKEYSIAVEINPISNQVLQLVGDLRNHPASFLFANDYPVVVSSDDPSFWKATPLSHDFYVAFLGIASAHADLRLLKKLALNSFKYSAMNDFEKSLAEEIWQKKWDEFIKEILSTESGAAARLQTNKID